MSDSASPHGDFEADHLDRATRRIYAEALRAEPTLEEQAKEGTGKRYFGVRSPFKLGFVITLGALTAILFGEALGRLSNIAIYIVAALFIALGLDPVVRFLERRKVRRPAGIAIVFGSFLVFVFGVLALLIPTLTNQIKILVQRAPGYLGNIPEEPWFIDLNDRVGAYIDFSGILDGIRDAIANPDTWSQLAGGVVQAGVGIANGVTAALIVLILSLYFLASLTAMKRGLYLLAPRSSRATVIEITEQVTESIGGYVNGMVILAFMNASLGFVAMTIFEVPFAPLVAVAVFFLALIPLIGSVLATVLVTVVALFESPMTALSIGIYYLIYMQVESYFLTPKVMNRVVSVPGALVVIGALAGGTLLGLLGALIAIPVTAMVLMIVKQVWIPKQEFR